MIAVVYPCQRMDRMIQTWKRWTYLQSNCMMSILAEWWLTSLKYAAQQAPLEGFNKINEVLQKYDVPWRNSIGFSVDNTSTNLGKQNSVKTRVLKRNQECYFLGCPCHIIHNTSHKGLSAFTKVTDFDVEDFCIDLYYFFDKSSKRKCILQSYSEFCHEEYRQILKHVTVR